MITKNKRTNQKTRNALSEVENLIMTISKFLAQDNDFPAL